jgi:hypothetical protein
MPDLRVIRFVGRRRRICGHLDWVVVHASSFKWEHDPLHRDAVAFRLTRAGSLARDAERRPPDIAEADWTWLRDLARFGGVSEPEPEAFRRVVHDELPAIRARLEATLDG